MAQFDKAKFHEALQLLNDKLAMANQTLDILAVGGYAMQRVIERATEDIDAWFAYTTELRQMIGEVGKKLGINGEDLWLNLKVTNVNELPPDKELMIDLELSNLTVRVPSLEYLLGMKIKSRRDKDIADLKALVKELNCDDPIVTYHLIEKHGHWQDLDDILDAFAKIHSVDWVEEYIEQNSSEIENIMGI